MDKRLYIISLLIIADVSLFSAYNAIQRSSARATNQQAAQQGAMANFNFIHQAPQVQAPRIARAAMNNDTNNPADAENPFSLHAMQQMYASQPTNYEKAQYINSVLDYDSQDITIHQKIDQAKNLLRIMNNELSLHSGWLYNTDEAQVSWLRTQKSKINHRLSEFQWQAKHWSEQALWKTAYIGSAILGAIFAAYLAQYKYQEMDPTYEIKSFGELSWMPVEQLITMAQALVTPAQYAVGGVLQGASMAVTGTKALADYIREAGETIAIKGADRAQKDLHTLAKNVAKSTEPTPPSWSNLVENYWHPENKVKPGAQIQPQPQEIKKQQAPQQQNTSQQQKVEKKQPRQEDSYKGPKEISLWDWINRPFERWEYEKEVNRAAEWQAEMSEYQNNIELEMLKRQKEEALLQTQIQLEYQRMKDLNKPQAEKDVQKMFTEKQAQLEEQWAKADLKIKLEGQQLMNEAPESILAAMQAAQKQATQKK